MPNYLRVHLPQFAGNMLGKQTPWALRMRPPSSTECPDAAGRCHVYRRKVCGVRCLRGNWKLLYVNKGLSIVSATKLAKKYQLNFDLVLLFLWAFSSSKTWPERHPECTDRSCNKALTVMNQELPVSNVTPLAMTYLEIQRTDHPLHPMTP